jgi:hypothetical protein
MLAVLGGLADVERDLIRTPKAQAAPMPQGRRMGRPLPLPWSIKKRPPRRRGQGATLKELAHSYNVGISTIRRVTRGA